MGQPKMMKDTKIKAEERFPITGQGFASEKLLDGQRMSSFVRHRCYKVLHVKVLLFVMQNSTHTTKVLFQYTENSSAKQTVC